MIRLFAGVVTVIGALALSNVPANAINGGVISTLPSAAKPNLSTVQYYEPEFGRWRLRCDWDDYWCRRRYRQWRHEGRDWWWNDRGRRWHWDGYRRQRVYSGREYCWYHPGHRRCVDDY